MADKATEKTVTVRVLRAFWPQEDVRVNEGTVIEVTVDEAMDGLESGSLERVKGDEK